MMDEVELIEKLERLQAYHIGIGVGTTDPHRFMDGAVMLINGADELAKIEYSIPDRILKGE